MRHAAFGLMLLAFPALLLAQRWSAEQQEVIRHIEGCWDGWISVYEESQSFDRWVQDDCPTAPDALQWVTTDGAPTDFEMERRALEQKIITRLWLNPQWLDLRPVSIKIDGDVVLIHYYAVWVADDAVGQASQTQQKRLEVYRKLGEDYVFLGGMVSPVPQAD